MNYSGMLKIVFFFFVVFSLFVIYFNLVIKQDYEIFTNEGGPDTSDYFLIEEVE